MRYALVLGVAALLLPRPLLANGAPRPIRPRPPVARGQADCRGGPEGQGRPPGHPAPLPCQRTGAAAAARLRTTAHHHDWRCPGTVAGLQRFVDGAQARRRRSAVGGGGGGYRPRQQCAVGRHWSASAARPAAPGAARPAGAGNPPADPHRGAPARRCHPPHHSAGNAGTIRGAGSAASRPAQGFE